MSRLISWNVNGLRACVGKGFLDFFREADADVFCLQETKLQAGRDIINIGIMRRRRATPAPRCSVSRSRSPWPMGSAWRSTTGKAG